MGRSNVMFTTSFVLELREEMSKRSSAADLRTVLTRSLPPQTAEYINNVNFSREEMNEAYARARAEERRSCGFDR